MKDNFSLDDMISVLELEARYLEIKFENMDHDGGRFNTAAQVLRERVAELKELLI